MGNTLNKCEQAGVVGLEVFDRHRKIGAICWPLSFGKTHCKVGRDGVRNFSPMSKGVTEAIGQAIEVTTDKQHNRFSREGRQGLWISLISGEPHALAFSV